jgi:hypothetical protein
MYTLAAGLFLIALGVVVLASAFPRVPHRRR